MACLIKTVIGVGSILVVLSGCALNQAINPLRSHDQNGAGPVNESKTVVVKAASEVDRLLIYYREMLEMSPQAYHVELQKMKEHIKRGEKDDERDLKYALLLLRPDSASRDTEKAAELFSRYQAKNRKKDEAYLLSSLSMLMAGVLEEHRRTAEENRDLLNRLSESQKQLHHVQDQINALKSIEKSIHDRNTRVDVEGQLDHGK